jgi:hypothetical protein
MVKPERYDFRYDRGYPRISDTYSWIILFRMKQAVVDVTNHKFRTCEDILPEKLIVLNIIGLNPTLKRPTA